MLLEQIRAQKVEGPNAELREENESLRDELEAQIERVAYLEMMVEQQKSIIEEGEAVKIEREQLRKTNEKLRLDLEAITEKGQVIVPLHSLLKIAHKQPDCRWSATLVKAIPRPTDKKK